MKKRRLAKYGLVLLAVLLSLQGGTALYTYAKNWTWINGAEESAQTESSSSNPVQGQGTAVTSKVEPAPAIAIKAASNESPSPEAAAVVLSEEVLLAIKQSDPSTYDRNVNNYKQLLTVRKVPETFRSRLDTMLLDGAKVSDVRTAYEFVYQQFGTMAEVEKLAAARKSGRSWEDIFRQYKQETPAFIPQEFESGYLESLMNTPGLTADDIMIADQISFRTQASMKDLLNSKLAGKSWQQQCAEAGLLFTGTAFPRVSVTAEQLERYTSSVMSEEKVVEAFVLAAKLELQADAVINKLKEGISEEALYAEAYTARYNAPASVQQ